MWDPCLIISQIVAVQCVFYISLAVWVIFVDFWTGSPRSLDQFFKPSVNMTLDSVNPIMHFSFVHVKFHNRSTPLVPRNSSFHLLRER